MKVPSTINGKLWAPARVRGNQRPMAPLFPSMTSLQHFTILFLSINLFKHSTKSQNGRKQHQQTNTFTSHWCFVWYFWYSWWGHGGALVFFAFVLKVTHFPPPPLQRLRTHPDARNVQCAGQRWWHRPKRPRHLLRWVWRGGANENAPDK